MKTVYINEKRKLTTRKIKKIAKKLNRTNKKEEIITAISKDLMENKELIREIESYKIKVLDRKVDVKIFSV